MADIALVHLALDSSGVVAGEKQATRALQSVDSAMQRTEKQSAQLNTSLNANVKKSGESFKGLADGASRAGASLSSLGGPVGRVAGELTNLGGQVSDLVGSFGLVGGAAIAAVAGIAAVGGAIVSLTLDGIRLSDNLGDMAQSLGFSAEQMERLNAASRLAGEDVNAVERAFSTFQGTIKAALSDPAGEADNNLRKLGIEAKKAAKDTQGAFLDMVSSLSSVTSNFEQLAAAREVFGRGTHSLIRTSEEFNRLLRLSQKELEDLGFATNQAARDAAATTDRRINEMSLKWETFKRQLAEDWAPAIVGALESITRAMKDAANAPVPPSPLGGFGIAGIAQGIVGRANSNPKMAELFKMGFGQVTPNLSGTIAALPPAVKPTKAGGGGAKEPPSIPILRGITFDQALRLLGDGMKLVEERAEGVANGLAAVNARMLEILGARAEWIRQGVPLPTPGSPVQQAQPGQIIPGLPASGLPPHPSTVRTEEQARLDEQFSAIFDDMLISILTAQKTVGQAFAGLAIGVVDTFAIEFTKALRESFVTPVIRGLTDMLQSALKDLFGGLSAGGLKGVFGGIAKGIGTIFGGFFASGGTLGPGKFGVAGERGPELIFSGNQPMHIAPVTAGSAGNVFNISVGVNAPSGTVDKRTQDQLAATVMNAVKRAQRNEGAR